MSLLSYRNMSGSLGRREMLWEHKLTSKCFHSLHPDFHSHLYNAVETWKTCFLFHLENTALKKKKFYYQNVNLCHHYVNSLCYSSSVFLANSRNTIFNQSVCIFSLDHFLNTKYQMTSIITNTTIRSNVSA